MKRTLWGMFVLLVPMLFMAGCSDDDKTLSAGDDTYVPDFRAGNLTFSQVWVPDVVEGGYPVDIWFDVTADEPKYNVYVRLDLLRLPSGNALDLTIDPATYTPDYQLTALVVDQLAQGETRHVTHQFDLPPDIRDGTYAAVFTVNQVDFFPDDDTLQGEVAGGEDDNFMVAPASVIVGNPDKPNLRILNAELANNSFEINDLVATNLGNMTKAPALNLSLEVEAMGAHATSPVDIVFDLDIPGVGSYPLTFSTANDVDGLVVDDVWTYPVVCRMLPDEGTIYDIPADAGTPPVLTEEEAAFAEPEPEVEVCASLFRQSQVGRAYQLHLPEAAHQALATLATETTGVLRVQIDPSQTISEWENNISDNVMEFPVVFLPDTPLDASSVATAASLQAEGPYPHSLFSFGPGNSWGNNMFGAEYSVGPRVSWDYFTAGTNRIPTAFYAGNDYYFNAKIFNQTITILGAFQNVDLNADNIAGSGFDFGLTLANIRIWGLPERLAIGNLKDSEENFFEIWSTQDDDGNEIYAKRKEFPGYKATHIVYIVPVEVTANVVGEAGIRGSLEFSSDPGNTLILEGGPYFGFQLKTSAAVNLALAKGGIRGYLTLIDFGPNVQLYLQFQPSATDPEGDHYGVLGLGLPVRLQTLGGKIAAFAEWKELRWKPWRFYFVTTSKEKTFIEWNGLLYEYNLLGAFIKPQLYNVFGPYFKVEIPGNSYSWPFN